MLNRLDIQQVFYRIEENVPGYYAQKPLKAIERIIMSATDEKEEFIHLMLTLYLLGLQ